MNFTRENLYHRHRLSHQQIDNILGENLSRNFLSDKLSRLEAVKNFLLVTDLIRQSGISFISLKGPLLSERIYGDASVRKSHDVDILIELEKLEEIIALLLKNDFTFSEGVDWSEKKILKYRIIQTEHHLSFYHQKLNFTLEVHWILMTELNISLNIQKRTIEANLTEKIYSGRSFTLLNKEFELLYLIIHGSRHKWFRIKWLVDILVYPTDQIDTSKFWKLVELFKAQRIVLQTNYLLKYYFDKNLSFIGELKTPGYLENAAISAISNESDETLSIKYAINKIHYHWLMFPGISYKFKVLYNILFRKQHMSKIFSILRHW